VLLNLVRNALQAMPGGGTLTVGAAAGSDGIRLTVGDTGSGIPAAAREEIFRPFFTTRARGTGLGLTVVRGLTEAMGGRLEVESEVGLGATFTVVLPAGEDEG
jgi:signal transduction histidine kinase